MELRMQFDRVSSAEEGVKRVVALSVLSSIGGPSLARVELDRIRERAYEALSANGYLVPEGSCEP